MSKIPKIDQDEADRLLEKLGEKIAQLYDDTMQTLSFSASGGNPRLERRWNKFLAQQPSDLERQNKTIRHALEILLHDALFCLQEQREFRIQALAKDGSWVNIDEYSDGIHGDLGVWLEEKSKYGCVVGELLQIDIEE